MKVFRWETAAGLGPYNNPTMVELAETLQQLTETRLDVFTDLSYILHSEVCCFRSLYQMRKWFTKQAIMLLESAGYTLYVYEVEDHNVRHGKEQSVFSRNDCHLSKRIPLKSKTKQ